MPNELLLSITQIRIQFSKKEHRKIASDRAKIKEWLLDRDNLTRFVEKNIEFSLTGFKNVMEAILDINDFLNLKSN